jgi:hypothetical protein
MEILVEFVEAVPVALAATARPLGFVTAQLELVVQKDC